MKIALIGIYPPPYGGISVHIQRLSSHLKARNVGHTIYDISGVGKNVDGVVCVHGINRWLLKYIFFAREDIIHYHSSNWLLRIVFGLMSFLGKKTIVSVHGESLNTSLKKSGRLCKMVIKFALKHTSFIIADNQRIKNLALSLEVSPDKITVLPAFIPPPAKEEDFTGIPEYILRFIDSHKPIISGTACQISFVEGIDLYGLDLCVELVSSLQKNYPKIGLVFCLPVIGDRPYFNSVLEKVRYKKLDDNILFVTEPLVEAYPVWAKSDIFVRPTFTDGDSLSIREAMHFNVPVVASDTVPRPGGVVLFKNRDLNDFVVKVEIVLERGKRSDLYMSNNQGAGNEFDKFLEVYNELAK